MVVQHSILCQNISTKQQQQKLNHNYSVLWRSLDFFSTMVGFLHLFLIILKLLMRIKIPAKLEKIGGRNILHKKTYQWLLNSWKGLKMLNIVKRSPMSYITFDSDLKQRVCLILWQCSTLHEVGVPHRQNYYHHL